MTEEEKKNKANLDELIRETNFLFLEVLEKQIPKLRNPTLRVNLGMLTSLNLLGNMGIHAYIKNPHEAKDEEKLAKAAAQTVNDLLDWFSGVMHFNEKQGMN